MLNGVRGEDNRPLFVAVVFSALSILSVLYQPNYSHFGVVGAVWLTLLAESLERFVSLFEGGLRKRRVGLLAYWRSGRLPDFCEARTNSSQTAIA